MVTCLVKKLVWQIYNDLLVQNMILYRLHDVYIGIKTYEYEIECW